jgi:hypothetical protein
VVSRNIRPFDPAPPFPFLPAFSRSHLFMKVSNKDANGSKINSLYILASFGLLQKMISLNKGE